MQIYFRLFIISKINNINPFEIVSLKKLWVQMRVVDNEPSNTNPIQLKPRLTFLIVSSHVIRT